MTKALSTTILNVMTSEAGFLWLRRGHMSNIMKMHSFHMSIRDSTLTSSQKGSYLHISSPIIE